MLKIKPFRKNLEYLLELLKVILQLYYKETPTQMFSCKCLKISKNTCLEKHLRTAASEVTLGIDCLGFLSGPSLSKPYWLINITKIPVAFKPEPSLNLTPTLYFRSRFPVFIINGYNRKSKRL